MIEMRTFEGDARDLSEFSRRVWLKAYGGKLPIPLWSPEFFEWQLFDEILGARRFMVAAYDGARLVGLLPCQPIPYDLRGQTYQGSLCSWQSVDPDYRRRGVSKGMLAEQIRRHLDEGYDFSIGYPLAGTAGPQFWSKGNHAGSLGKLGVWFRMLDHAAVADWEPSRWAAFGARALRVLQRRLPEPEEDCGIRPYRPEDLPDCLELVRSIQRESDLSVAWTTDRLAHHLSYKDLPRTLVMESAGRVAGFVNYHLTPFRGKTEIRIAIIDLIAFGSLPRAARRNLLRTALHRIRDEGAALATVMAMTCYPWRDMVRAGFLPFPGVVRIDYFYGKTRVDLDGVRRIFLLCR